MDHGIYPIRYIKILQTILPLMARLRTTLAMLMPIRMTRREQHSDNVCKKRWEGKEENRRSNKQTNKQQPVEGRKTKNKKKILSKIEKNNIERTY